MENCNKYSSERMMKYEVGKNRKKGDTACARAYDSPYGCNIFYRS